VTKVGTVSPVRTIQIVLTTTFLFSDPFPVSEEWLIDSCGRELPAETSLSTQGKMSGIYQGTGTPLHRVVYNSTPKCRVLVRHSKVLNDQLGRSEAPSAMPRREMDLMDDCDLNRLNPIAFERLIRALCFATMGPAGTVYSQGPDGGRDFVYDGTIKGYEGKRWKGYLVVQAKFKDPSSSNVDDLSWLKSQLGKELKKYSQPGSRLRKPEYYILVTNVRLSGSDGTANKKTGRERKGGHSKALELFSSWKTSLDLKGFDVWPRDKIVDLLVAQPAIRQNYAQWITSGDVLAKALEHFKTIRPDFADIASRSLKVALQRDQFVRLKDAGSEVPPTGERPAILDAISIFFTEASEVNADILVVVTTRPQGYNKDLDEKLWEHWRLADLEPEQALNYAKAFGEARYPEDVHRREDVHRSLVRAAEQGGTNLCKAQGNFRQS
jgi:hypothetical protein